MRLLACPLLLALFAFGSSVPSPEGAVVQTTVTPVPSPRAYHQRNHHIRQSPQSVNVRPRVATPQPGVPAVKATVDRNRVPLGDLVTFTLTPASVVLNPRYTVTIYFGDRQQARAYQPQIDHLYTYTGNFTYSILVKPSEPPSPPAVPTVKLSAKPTPVETDRLVTFTAALSQSYPNIKYRFVFADGSDSGWQVSSEATHSYRSPATYRAYVEIGLGNIGSVKQVGGSLRRAVEVTSPPPTTIAVQLTADRVTVQAKDEVKFTAKVDSPRPKIEYRFEFGDSSGAIEWQASPRIRHVYSSAGTYPATVYVRVVSNRSSQQTGGSEPLSIKVESAPLRVSYRVDLIAVPQSVFAGLPVYFKATADSADSKTRYRFNFGDGSPPTAWKETPEDTHIYSLAGRYPAFVEISQTSNEPVTVASSAPKQIRVTQVIVEPPGPTPGPTAFPSGSPKISPTVIEATSPSPGPTSAPTDSPSPGPTPSPLPTDSPTPILPPKNFPDIPWWPLLLVPPLLYGGYRGWKYFFAPRPTLETHLDPGAAALGTEGGPFGFNFQMELDPSVTDGQYSVNTDEGSFIKSERKSDD